MTAEQTKPVEVFFSYAHADERLRKGLDKYLVPLRRQGQIKAWYDHEIGAGKERMKEIDAHLSTARVILLLVSPDFIASDYCYDVEVKRAVERHKAGEACVIPIILRQVNWKGTPFAELQSLPTNGKPIASWSKREDALFDVAEGIRKAIEEVTSSFQSNQTILHSEQGEDVPDESLPQSMLANTIEVLGKERPANAFLSYRREDTEEVRYLQQQLKVRGVRAWRDVTDLSLGDYTPDKIIHAIEQESDAFVIYITQQCLTSDFIWDVEVPTALKRWERDRTFNIVPIFRGVSFAEMQQFCAARGYRSLAEFNGTHLPDSITDETKVVFEKEMRLVAERVLKATLDIRLHRVGAERSYEPCIYLHTFDYEPPAHSLDLDLDWRELFKEKDEVPTEKEWDEVLFPALLDVKKVLSAKTPSRRLHIFVQGILPTAFALGHTFPDSSHFTLLLEGRHGTWSTQGSTSVSLPLRSFSYPNTGDSHVAVVEIAISRNTASGLARNLSSSGLSFKHHIRFEPPNGPDHISAVRDASEALAMSHQLGREMRRLCDSQGVSHIHLFAALPAALAVMVGHQLNSMCPVTLYHYIQADECYVPVCTLGKAKNRHEAK